MKNNVYIFCENKLKKETDKNISCTKTITRK